MIATPLVLGDETKRWLVTILAVAVVSIGGIVLPSYLGVTIAGRLGKMNPRLPGWRADDLGALRSWNHDLVVARSGSIGG